MVARTWHRTGVGSFSLRRRLTYLAETTPELEAVLLDTSHYSQRFFARFGFETVGVIPEPTRPAWTVTT